MYYAPSREETQHAHETQSFDPVRTATAMSNVTGREFSNSFDGYSSDRDAISRKSSGVILPAQGNHTIESFFGNSISFHAVYESIRDCGASPPSKSENAENLEKLAKTEVCPGSIRKLVLVGHPVTTFSGIDKFVRLAEVCISSCKIKEAKWSDLENLKHIRRMYLYHCGLQKIEPFRFPNIKVLCVADNKLSSLNFLGQGIPTLQELNAARNDITCLHEEQLANCANLHTLNLSGNPLCTVQDIQALKALPALKTLHLSDPVYGKCPVATLCDSRTMLLSILTNITNLDGKVIISSEISSVQNYVFTRSLFYFSNSLKNDSEQVAKRKAIMSSAHKKLEKQGYRILQLVSLDARLKRTMSAVEILPVFANAKNTMKDHIAKIQERITALNEHAKLSLKRVECMMTLSRWEQETEKWLKWIEFQAYGNLQCALIYSVHGNTSTSTPDPSNLRATMHRLISSLSCAGLWPHSTTMVKVESVFAVRDKGMDIGIQRTYEAHYQVNVEPPYIPPQELLDDIEKPIPPNTATYPFYTFPAYQSHRDIPTYTSPDYEPPKPMHPFPDSVAGLPEKSQTLYMFLVCPQNSANPLPLLQKLMTEKTRDYKEVRVTNCLWLASPLRGQKFSVVIVVKVLSESLQAISCEKSASNHAWDCACFSLKHPHSISPAYILNISFTQQDKVTLKLKLPSTDDDVLNPAESDLTNLSAKLTSRDTVLALGMYTPSSLNKKSSFCLTKTGNGLHADLSTMHVTFSLEEFATSSTNFGMKSKESFNSSGGLETSLTKYLGSGVEPFLTSLNLSGNKIGMTVGLKGLRSLKSLNLSHNNLTTLSGLERLPSLIELKVGFNSLRFLLSNAKALSLATPRLLTLEISPNPFQDIRDLTHLPALLRRILPFVHRVDIWTTSLPSKSELAAGWSPPDVADAGFAQVAMAKTWDGTMHAYNDLAGQSLSDLKTVIPSTPPFTDSADGNAMDLNLSDNYLSSHDLVGMWVLSAEWRVCIVKLQLQENLIASLNWLKDRLFPSLQILNLSNNLLRDLEHLSDSCPNLRHLQLAANPLPSNIEVLHFIRNLRHLITLDCSACPISTHTEYSTYIRGHLGTVQMLDGVPIAEWEFSNSVDRAGGILTQYWLESKFRAYNDNNSCSTNNLTLSNCSIQKLALSHAMLSRLSSINLQHNALSTLTTLSSLACLRVLSLGNNCISSLGGSPCPTCYSHTVQSQAANSQKLRHAKIMELKSQSPTCNIRLANSILKTAHNDPNFQSGSAAFSAALKDAPAKKPTPPTPKSIFPKLEVMILSHNGLSGLSDLHFHAMPCLHTILLCCNSLSSLKGLENIPTLTALVLDNNHIRDIPHNCLAGCKSLKYLHLEHNRLSSLPRLPHLTNLTELYLAHNKLQSLTEVECLTKGSDITECSLKGNLLSSRIDYRLNIATKLPHVNVLDGKDLGPDRAKLQELKKRLYAARPSPPVQLSKTTSSMTPLVRGHDRHFSAKP